ncbi:HD domain-containing protein [Corynebacterium frankenforstense]|uniref:HD domain-containing protein n=1 Tax=Corynebacterium frankenforstense TaxID=1230998 RepID=UPI0026EDE3EB|nr:HD domain-containing protein [Corynebacterium frankenforstense]
MTPPRTTPPRAHGAGRTAPAADGAGPATATAAASAIERRRLATLELPAGTALAATGSLARDELTGHSDLDLVLIYRPGAAPEADAVEAVWDAARASGRHVDHALRTPAENAEVLAAEPIAALALLDLSAVAGEAALVEEARRLVRTAWRRELPRRLDAVLDAAIERWRRSGSVVAMTRPDVKHGRGGLRDHELLRALALANLCDAPALTDERDLLLRVRAALHRLARRRRDILDPEFAADIAVELGFADRFDLARGVADAGRAIDAALTAAVAGSRDVLRTPARREPRRPLDVDVVESGGQVRLARNAALEDPGLPLRVAAVSARTGLPVPAATWDRLTGAPGLPRRLPKPAAADFVTALSSPLRTAENVAALDARGLWTPLVPEWDRIRGLMPRERTHVHTVERHTLETVAGCARVAIHVSRPDLLLIAGLYHDVGKGSGRPHAAVGAEAVARLAGRLGLPLRDRSCLQTVVAEHSTIARIAARRDPDDPAALGELLDATAHDLRTIELLAALVEADSKATGPGVWTHQLALCRDTLLAAARRRLSRFTPVAPVVSAPAGGEMSLVERGEGRGVLHWRGRPGELSRLVAVCNALAWVIDQARCRVDPEGLLVTELEVRGSLGGRLDLPGFRQAFLSGVHTTPPVPAPGPVAVSWEGRFVDVHTRDRPGVLAVLADVLPEFEWLTLTTAGATVTARAALRVRPGVAERPALDDAVRAGLGGM